MTTTFKPGYFYSPQDRVFCGIGRIHASVPEWEAKLLQADLAGMPTGDLVPDVWLIPFCCMEVDPRPVPEGKRAVANADGSAWIYEDVPVAAVPVAVPLTEAQLREQFIQAAQTALNMVARAWGYDNIFTACTYADEPAVPQFQAEGQALRRYRSEFWAAAYGLVRGPDDTIDTLLAQLPSPPARPTPN
jgi:hypothetical protein